MPKKNFIPPSGPDRDASSDPPSDTPETEYYDPDMHYPPEPEDEDDGAADAVDGSTNQRLREMMDRNFIEYASYVIKDRAIPDVDDGLKPVQRRILWTLHEKDNGTFHKVANIIGETMKYHPHGDASIGDALVNLANKECFIDKQGSFGDIILGTPAAAPRYIECRLSKLGRDVLFNDDITMLVDSYDSRNKEPVCLPSKIPTLLLMGTNGLAVGTRTMIFPHNFNELLRAQISILKGEPFQIYPDFPQGGIMDVSEYQDGLGKIVLRARIVAEKHDIVIREIHAATDTSKLMDSIESAVNKSRIKISSFHDYTANDQVNIELSLQRGYSPEKAINALYTYTDCQMSVSCTYMVICDNRPVRMSASDILRRNTQKLVQYLTWELQLAAAKCIDRILGRTLAQIFIEEKIYKKIETCKSKDAMFEAVRAGLEKFKDEWLPLVQALYGAIEAGPHITPPKPDESARIAQLAQGIIPDSEIERLVEIPIRRIAAFEIDRNREEIAGLQKELSEAEKNLKHIKQYTIKYIEGLLEKYGHLFPRRTEIRLEPFAKIDKSVAALSNIRVGWDKKNCYIGTSVKSEDIVLCNEFDHLLCVERSGDFKVIDIPDKIFIDRLFEFRRYDKNTVFGVVYSEKKTGRAFFKRTRIAQFIKDREYRIAPEGCRLELITPRPNAIYEIKVDTPIKAKQVQQISLMDAPERSPKAGGILISPRKLLKITFVRLLDESDAAPEPELVEVPPDDDGGNGGNGGNGAGNGNIPASEETKPAPANPPEPSPVEPVQSVDAAPQIESEPEAKPVKRRIPPKKDAGSASPASSEVKKAPEPKPPVEAQKASEPRSPVEVKKASDPKPVVKPVPTAKTAPQPPVKPAPQPPVKPAPQTQPDAEVKSQVSAAEPEKKPEPPENKTDSSKRSVDTEREEDSWDVQPDLGF
jgi:topoisomerase-4 subunit A